MTIKALDLAQMVADDLRDSDRIASAAILDELGDDEDGPVTVEVATQGGVLWRVTLERA